MLRIENLFVSYGAIRALNGISLEVEQGSIVALIGGNGAGKTTALRTISGLLRPTQGRIEFLGEDLTKLAPHQIVARGLSHVPEGRMIFANLTVAENLAMGAYLLRDPAAIARNRDYCFGIFPRLKERLDQTAGTLSGGEQQMLAIARALMARPTLLLLDEPSLGLAPQITEAIFEIIAGINREGMTILLVEQNAHLALGIAHHAHVLETGSVVQSGTGEELLKSPAVRKAYLGE